MPTTPTYAFRYQAVTDAPHGANLGLNLATDVENKIIVVDAKLAEIQKVVTINNASGSGTTTSGTYVDYPAPSSLSFTKVSTATALLVWAKASWFSTLVASGACALGVRINSVDYDLDRLEWPPNNQRVQLVGTNRVAAGLAAGTYTVQLRWARTAGTGTLNTDGSNWVSMSVREVA